VSPRSVGRSLGIAREEESVLTRDLRDVLGLASIAVLIIDVRLKNEMQTVPGCAVPWIIFKGRIQTRRKVIS
jgi:hypothetical protein